MASLCETKTSINFEAIFNDVYRFRLPFGKALGTIFVIFVIKNASNFRTEKKQAHWKLNGGPGGMRGAAGGRKEVRNQQKTDSNYLTRSSLQAGGGRNSKRCAHTAGPA